MKKKKDLDMRNWFYFSLYFSGEFLSTVYSTFKNFPISSLIKRHSMQCNTYTLKLSCTVNLSRLSYVTIQVTLSLINKKFFNAILNILLNSIRNSSQVTNKVAATLLLKAKEIFRFTKDAVFWELSEFWEKAENRKVGWGDLFCQNWRFASM